ETHLLRLIDRYVDFSFVRDRLQPFYSSTGRPSIDPEVLLRLLLVGYLYGISSERRLLDEVRMHLAYRWFTRLGLEQEVPEHSTFSKNRHGRFRQDATWAVKWGRAGFAYYDNYLIDNASRVIVDVAATPARFRHESLAARQMLERIGRLGLRPESLGADKA